jgi:hypothetical protein
VRVDKVYTLEQTLIVRVFGQVDPRTVHRIRTLLDELTTPTP